MHQQFPGVQATFQGEALVFRQLFRALPLLLLAAIFVMYVILGILYESYVHPITVLFPAIVPAVVGGLFTLWIFGSTLSLYSVIGLFLLLGIVKKNGIMVVDFALATNRRRLGSALGNSRSERGTVSADHDDDARRVDGRDSARARFWSGRFIATSARPGDRWRSDFLANDHALRHARDLSLARMVPGARAGQSAVPYAALTIITKVEPEATDSCDRAASVHDPRFNYSPFCML